VVTVPVALLISWLLSAVFSIEINPFLACVFGVLASILYIEFSRKKSLLEREKLLDLAKSKISPKDFERIFAEAMRKEFSSPYQAAEETKLGSGALGMRGKNKKEERVYSAVHESMMKNLEGEGTISRLENWVDRVEPISAIVDNFLEGKKYPRDFLESINTSDDFCNAVKKLYPHLDHIRKVKEKMQIKIYECQTIQKSLISSKDKIDSMTGIQFEDLVAEIFKRKGFSVKKTPQTGDFGVDLIASQLGVSAIAIQCKRYNENYTVGSEDVMKLKGGASMYSATNCMLITTSYLTKKAKDACSRLKIEFWERETFFSEIELSGIFERSKQVDIDISRLVDLQNALDAFLSSLNSGNVKDYLNKIDAELDGFPNLPNTCTG
jgi:HJR/Mrr/RecB family endonuclease